MKKIMIILITFIISYSVYPNNFNEYIQKGDEYYSEFNNKSALDYYLKAYKFMPDGYNILSRLARTYNDLGEEYYEYREEDSSEVMIRQAIKFSEEMQKEFPDSAATYAYLAMSYGNQALYEGGKEKIKLAHKIEDNAKKSIQMNPGQYMPYVILGIYYRQIADLSWFERMFANTFFGNVPDGSFEQSIAMFQKALALKPNTIVASFQLSLTYKAMGDNKKEKYLLQELINYPEKNFRDKFALKKAKKRLEEMG
jgi:tetratricopeptide (TPR) repeat protein